MYIDKDLEMSSAQAVTASAASTNVFDFGPQARSESNGGQLYVTVRVGTAATAAGAATLVVAFQSSIDAAFSSPIAKLQTAVIGKAALTADTEIFKFAIPKGMERYGRMYYTVATGPLTAGTFDAFITVDPQSAVV
tara:strand:+ start:21929 stop:22336 length:408 start_codon:yes stop_codon:yes gene_type:complete